MPPTTAPLLLELQYLPPVSYFALLANSGGLWLEQHEHYVKGSYRNRCHIAGANGVQRLTVPLRQGKNQQQHIRDVRIAYAGPWQAQHWQSIRSAYGRSPFFEHFAHRFEPFFTQKKYELLWDWNLDLLRLCLELLRLDTPLFFTESYQATPESGMTDGRGAVSPKKPSPFPLLPYPQVFLEKHGFLADLSVLDLIFCTGPAGKNILTAEH